MKRPHLPVLLFASALALTACGGAESAAPPAARDVPPSPSADPSGGIANESLAGGDGQATPGLPSRLPSQLPSKPPSGLPSELPSRLPSELPSAVPSQVVNAFVACMRKQGVKVPADVSTWQPDPQDARTQRALAACIGLSGAPGS